MATVNVNGLRLFYELSGNGAIPLVLVHGAWVSRHHWDLIVPSLTESFRVLTYDRRGHSESQRRTGQASMRENVADLAALIEKLGLAPAWIVGGSLGASITLRLAGERPDLFRGLIAHEPPLFSLLEDDAIMAPLLKEVRDRSAAVAGRIASGDPAGAAEQFVDTIAFGPAPGGHLPADLQQTFIANAPAFLDESKDPEQLAFDLEWIKTFSRPSLFTTGNQSPPPFTPVIAKLAGALPNVETMTFRGAGHIPHVTHPHKYVEAIGEFIRKNST